MIAKLVTALIALLLVSPGLIGFGFGVLRTDPATAGVRALQSDDAEEAYTQLAALVAERGGDASVELLTAFAIAAIRSGRPVDATVAIETAAAGSAHNLDALRDFVLGQAAYLEAEAIGRQARQPNADPTTFDQAIGKALTAAVWWRGVLDAEIVGAAPGTVARNLERAVRLTNLLRREKEQVLENAQKRKDQQQNEKEGEPDDAEQRKEEIEIDNDPLAGPNGFDEAALKLLLDKLAREQLEKRAIRDEARNRRSRSVRRDW